MSTLYELKAAQYEYERRLRAAEHDRQVKRLENANGEGLANRVAKGVADIRAAAAGIRARGFEPTPSYLACSWCAFRDVCPASVAR